MSEIIRSRQIPVKARKLLLEATTGEVPPEDVVNRGPIGGNDSIYSAIREMVKKLPPGEWLKLSGFKVRQDVNRVTSSIASDSYGRGKRRKRADYKIRSRVQEEEDRTLTLWIQKIQNTLF